MVPSRAETYRRKRVAIPFPTRDGNLRGDNTKPVR